MLLLRADIARLVVCKTLYMSMLKLPAHLHECALNTAEVL